MPEKLGYRLYPDIHSSHPSLGLESHSGTEEFYPDGFSEINTTQFDADTAERQSTSTSISAIGSGFLSSELSSNLDTQNSTFEKGISNLNSIRKVITKRRPSRNPGTWSTKVKQIEVNRRVGEKSAVGNSSGSGEPTVKGGVSGVAGSGHSFRPSNRSSACTYCKRLKMKCVFEAGENTCRRCKPGGRVCIVEGRKIKKLEAPSGCKHLLAQIKQKDAIIECLLQQFHNPSIVTPLLAVSNQISTPRSGQNKENIMEWRDRIQTSIPSASRKGEIETSQGIGRNAEGDDSDIKINRREQSVIAPDNDNQVVSCDDTEQKSLSLPDSSPLGLIAKLSLNNTKSVKKDPKKIATVEEIISEGDDVGVANVAYFMPGPAPDLNISATSIERHNLPQILVHGVVTPEDVDDLFKIFFSFVNPFVSILDPYLHTPVSTFQKSPSLFTVVCAVSSRYSKKPEIYPIAMHFARNTVTNALNHERKSVELCQAYILMGLYSVPGRRWEENTSWLYTGIAISIATDLNLHQVSTLDLQNEKQGREMLNRIRTWLICYTVDRWSAIQLGKPWSIKEDNLMLDTEEWYKKGKYNHPYDVHQCAYSGLVRMTVKVHDEISIGSSSPNGFNKMVDFRVCSVVFQYDAQLRRYQEEWTRRFFEDSDPNDATCSLRSILFQVLVAYSRLVMFSSGFAQAYQRGVGPGAHVYFNRCMDAAKSVIQLTVASLASTGYMRYAPDEFFISPSFASVFLLELLRSEFSVHITVEQETKILSLVRSLVETLSSPEIAVNDRHTPKLYARFLASLLSRRWRGKAAEGCQSASGGNQSQGSSNDDNTLFQHAVEEIDPARIDMSDEGISATMWQVENSMRGKDMMMPRPRLPWLASSVNSYYPVTPSMS
ncbi:Protein priB [Termitomyces sp. T112]|nr:Protein priB [Termitomyces sp. T112]